jgi:uncharacterized SAM-binding protein YcdF (DUF218 family)
MYIFFIGYENFLIDLGKITVYEDKHISRVDVIIVLGGGTSQRVYAGLKLYKKGISDKFILTGDKLFWFDEKVSWNYLAKRFLIKRKVPKKNIFLIRSTSTYEDIKNSFEFMKKKGFKSAVIVSDLFHTRRIKLLVDKINEQYGFKIYVYPSNSFQYNLYDWWKRERGLLFWETEIVKMIFYKLKGYI